MAGPKPDDAYNPTLKIDPSTAVTNNYLNARASASDTGGQLASAMSGFGKDLTTVENNATNILLQRQGLANEHAVTESTSQLDVEGGKIYETYKNQQGLDAANSKDKAVQDYVDLRNKIRDSLGNPAAQRGFDQATARQTAFTIKDMNAYAAAQTNAAYKAGRVASMNLSLEQISRPEVASDPEQLGNALGNALFQANSDFTQDTYETVPATVDPKTHRLVYDTKTKDGKIAQSVYDDYISKVMDKGLENGYNAIAYSGQHPNPIAAAKFIEDHKEMMTPATYGKLSKQASAGVVGEQTRSIADDTINNATTQFQNTPIKGTSTTLTGAFLDQESGNGRTSTNKGQIQPDTWKQFARADENINDPNDNETVTARILDKYNKDYNGDTSRVAVAYFSGPGNVSPPGSATPYVADLKDKTGKSVSSYVNDIGGRLGNTPNTAAPSKADYLATHQDELIQGARDRAASLGLDLAGQDQAAARTQTRINQIVSGQHAEDRANDNVILKLLNSGKVTSVADLVNSSDPEIRRVWGEVNARNPQFALNVTDRIIPAMAKADRVDYGTDFYKHFTETLQGLGDAQSLSGYVGSAKNSPITTNGYKVITAQADGLGTPEGQAFAHAELAYLQKLHSQFTGSGQFPGISATESNAQFDKALMEVIPKINAARKQGLTPAQLFDPKSKDYVQTGVTPPTMAQMMTKMVSRTIADKEFGGPQGQEYKTPDDLVSALRDKKIDRKTFDDIAIKNKWAEAPKPQVPFSSIAPGQ